MKLRQLLVAMTLRLLAFAVTVPLLAAATIPKESKSQHDARMAWWREAKFGMFIHWGVYSVPAGEWQGKTNYAEWIMEQAKIPVSRYEQFAKEFNPVKFNAKAWVKTAKDAGMKYLAITSKHHDGFCMWPTKQTDWSICRTPWWQRTHRDPLKELSEECRRQGIKFCVYYSIMDWHSPDWPERRPWNDVATGKPDMERYVTYMKAELKELVTRYHPSVIWFDGEWESPWTHDRGVDLYNYLRALDPGLIVNNRVDKFRASLSGVSTNSAAVGDFFTPEQQIPSNGFGADVNWESCMTLNQHWGYNKFDEHWKSSAIIIRNLCDIASKGGNYLLNVGPTSQGLIPQPSVDRLEAIGQWMKVNGEAIHGTTCSPLKSQPSWGRVTQKGDMLYLHVWNWPGDGKLAVPGLKNKVSSAVLLATGDELKASSSADNVIVFVPAIASDKISSTIALKLQGAPEIE